MLQLSSLRLQLMAKFRNEGGVRKFVTNLESTLLLTNLEVGKHPLSDCLAKKLLFLVACLK